MPPTPDPGAPHIERLDLLLTTTSRVAGLHQRLPAIVPDASEGQTRIPLLPRVLCLSRLCPFPSPSLSRCRNNTQPACAVQPALETPMAFVRRLIPSPGAPVAASPPAASPPPRWARNTMTELKAPVYEEGAKEVALSVVSGTNSSIFEFGQTSSGKTYTMTGITEYNTRREFMLKFSAIEIYNEAVRDLLSHDTTPLRLLDDPEKGTTVEKLTEETLRNKDHLRDLLGMCEAQREIGETALNKASSRSHQILRLTIESSVKQYLGRSKSSTMVSCVLEVSEHLRLLQLV
ncbi:hypothetical protein ZWY2020_037979 [Hordeum vulgare]|nr:hypothetical protein ZWY2020_037979 [Hordeum vulgare]